MCFSETASFAAGTLLTVLGAASLHVAKRDRAFLLLGALPLFFALQQFSEGVIWHHLNGGGIKDLAEFAAYTFLFIAFLVWPIAIPYSLYLTEKVAWKKRFLLLSTLAGVVWSLYLFYTFFQYDVLVKNSGRSILYLENSGYFSTEWSAILKVIYIALLMVPIFVSSLRLMWIFGVLSLISALVTGYFYYEAFTSVWCFFAAILSLLLYKIIKANTPLEELA